MREKSGRPRLEIEQPDLLKAIVDIALYGSAAHEKRQSDVYRSIKTLQELTDQLVSDGFKISRSGVYLRLLPKRSSNLEGKRHVETVPVRLIRAQNDAHSKHIDMHFCTATIKHLEELASILGPNEVFFLSQDDKSRVPIGLTAANKQAPLLMHVEYRVSLPDHDWVVASKHKLIPSVYAAIQIKQNGIGNPESVTYSGPTYVAIRSGKHASSSALAHGLDFQKLLQLPEFDTFTKSGIDRSIKPVIIFTVDGGPDENPRYQKVIQVAIHHFEKHGSDAIFIATNAPGRSAFNRVERRMAPLSKELSGVILPHEHYGSHLDSQGRTIDKKKELENFGFAGQTLAEIWSSVNIDNFPTIANYIDPKSSELKVENLVTKDSKWFSQHVRTSQYFTQIVKCLDVTCCAKPRSSYFTVVPGRFIPPPIPIYQSADGLLVPERTDVEKHKFPSLFATQVIKFDEILPRSCRSFKTMPYDLFCPSVQTALMDRCCKICHLYFASVVMLKKHLPEHRESPNFIVATQSVPVRTRPVRVAARRQRELMAVIAMHEENGEHVEWVDEDELDVTGIILPQEEDGDDNPMPVITMEEHFTGVWEEEK